MRDIIKVKPKKNGHLILMEVENKKVEIKNFSISNKIKEETGWINAGNTAKIFERTKLLQTNKYSYEKGELYQHVSVMENLNYLVNESTDKLKTMRKIIEVFEGFNCVGTTRVIVEVNGKKQINLKEFVEEYLN